MPFASEYQHPDALIDTATLESRLDDHDLRIFDCTMFLLADSLDDPYTVQNGWEDYLGAHIPTAAYLDLEQICDPDSPYRFTMPDPAYLAEKLGEHGLGDGHRVVLYSRGTPQWATRVWWMLRAIGFDDVAVLDGGWEAWHREGRPAASGEEMYPLATLTPRPRAGMFVGADEVLDAIRRQGVCTINALSPESHAGKFKRYGRPGRVPGSVNVPVADLRDPKTGLLVDARTAAARFEAAGVSADQRVIVYCGGGIAATFDAFVLHQLGQDKVAIYDNSMSEWATTSDLPIETD
ncbi:MAG: sulfurtransferase [Burkholderiaceae bacterium]